MSILYLLGGNGSCSAWWQDTLPWFQRYRPITLELPGFGDNQKTLCCDLDELSQYVLTHTEPGSAIVATGVNALPVLQALVREPTHFSRVVLLAPVGAYLWKRKLPRVMRSRVLRRIVQVLLSRWPALFRRKFSRQLWTPAQYTRMGNGYRRCRAFSSYWDIMRADTALKLLDRIAVPIEIVWGGQDGIVDWRQAAAWSAILARADLHISLQSDWGHYPWIDDPEGFVHWLEQEAADFPAHTKAGRLMLAQLAGLPVPAHVALTQTHSPVLLSLLEGHPDALWAVRSSGSQEDGADSSRAGLSRTFLRVSPNQLAPHIEELLKETEVVIVQRYVDPKCSGVAFARHLSAEIEWVDGHLERLTDGRTTPRRAIISRMPTAWRDTFFPTTHNLTQKKLWNFLQAVVRIFHYAHCDIEWAWDGKMLHLLQVRPITDYDWRRQLTAANIGEILPAQPSWLVEYAQRRAAASIPSIWARWDSRVLEDNEPFTVVHAEASYINQDLFLARLYDWGFSGAGYVREIGGASPPIPLRPWRWFANLSVFCRMLKESRKALRGLESGLRRFDAELTSLIEVKASAQKLADWFTRFYVFVVQGNLCIGAAIASSGGELFGRPATIYRTLNSSKSPHRLPFETDPASTRIAPRVLPLQSFPIWPQSIVFMDYIGVPGLRGYYLQVREWYRDNVMRIFYRLHHAFPQRDRSHWFAAHASVRQRKGSFWQDGSESTHQEFGFILYPGHAVGRLGQEILLVDTLDPGLYETYRSAAAVIARSGGRLSHGATLLRELGKPSAVIPEVNEAWRGQWVRYTNGHLTLISSPSIP